MHLNLHKIKEVYNHSAGVILMMFATAITLMIIAGTGYLQPYDPVFGISIRILFGALAIVSFFVACCCFFSQDCWLPFLLVMWLTVTFYVYLFGMHDAGCNTLAGFIGDSTYCFGISPRTANILIICGAVYLTAGGCVTNLITALSKPVVETTLKISCAGCGGRIKFDDRDTGKTIACPHCESPLMLRKPDDSLKTSCYFCKRHIEFPAHALGRKIACPHCKKDIALKEIATA